MATTPRLTTYEFDEVTVVFGPILMDGFQDGEGVTVEKPEPTFTTHVGCDGKVTRSKTLNRTATVTIHLMQTSAQNDALSAIHIVDRDAPNGAGILPVYVRDRNGRSLHAGVEAWIERAPDSTYDRTPTTRDWVIAVAFLEDFIGGNG